MDFVLTMDMPPYMVNVTYAMLTFFSLFNIITMILLINQIYVTKKFRESNTGMVLHSIYYLRLFLRVNLSISDTMLCISTLVKVVFAMLYHEENDFGEVLCRTLHILQYASALVSSIIMVSIFADNYFSLVRVCCGKSCRVVKISTNVGILLTFCVWLVCVILTGHIYYLPDNTEPCASELSGVFIPTYYRYGYVALQHFVPVALIIIFIYCTYAHLFLQGEEANATNVSGKQLVLMKLFMNNLLFLLCGLPVDYYIVFNEYIIDLGTRTVQIILCTSHVALLIPTLSNIWSFGWLDKELREELNGLREPRRVFEQLTRHELELRDLRARVARRPLRAEGLAVIASHVLAPRPPVV